MRALRCTNVSLLGLGAAAILLAAPGEAAAYTLIGNSSCKLAPRPGPGLSSVKVRSLPPLGTRHRVGITLYGVQGRGGLVLVFCRRLATGYPALGPSLLLGVFQFTTPHTVSRDLVLPISFRPGSYKVLSWMVRADRTLPTRRVAYGTIR
jgi:hypothetical protein